MNFIKIDEEKLHKYIDVFYEQNKKYPYLICSKKTAEMLPNHCSFIATNIQTVAIGQEISLSSGPYKPKNISIDGKEYIPKNSPLYEKYWGNCKVIIDNDLEYGEIRIG